MKKIQIPRSITLLCMPALFLNVLSITACTEDQYAASGCTQGAVQTNAATCAIPDGTIINEAITQRSYVEKTGVSGRVIGIDYWQGATICFDNNHNGICEPSEPNELSYEQGKYSFEGSEIAASISANAPLLAIKNQQQQSQPRIVTAPSPTNGDDKNVNITVFTTLVMNETEFNPYALGSSELAVTQLQSGDFVIASMAALRGQDYVSATDNNLITLTDQVANSLYQAQSLTGESPYQAMAAMVDQMYQQHTTITSVTQAEINQQDIQSEGINIHLSSPAISWNTGHDDEVSTDLHIQDGLAVVGSKWHNRLTVIDLSNETPAVLSQNNFASSPGDRDEIDAFTGATEQVLSAVKVTPSTSLKPSVLVSVERHGEGNFDKGVGLYRADISDPSTIPEKRFAQDAGSVDYYPFIELNDMAISADGNTVILSNDDKGISVINSADFSQIQSFVFNSQVRSVALNESGSIAYVALFGARTGMAILDVNSGEETAFVSTGNQYPELFRLLKGSKKMALYLRNGKSVFIYDVSNPAISPVEITQIPVSAKIKSFAISDDGEVAVIGVSGGYVEVYSLTEQTPRFLQGLQVEGNSPINAVDFASNTRAILSLKNKIQTLDAQITLPSNWNDEQKANWYQSHRSPTSSL